jgi:hypothetical protein
MPFLCLLWLPFIALEWSARDCCATMDEDGQLLCAVCLLIRAKESSFFAVVAVLPFRYCVVRRLIGTRENCWGNLFLVNHSFFIHSRPQYSKGITSPLAHTILYFRCASLKKMPQPKISDFFSATVHVAPIQHVPDAVAPAPVLPAIVPASVPRQRSGLSYIREAPWLQIAGYHNNPTAQPAWINVFTDEIVDVQPAVGCHSITVLGRERVPLADAFSHTSG